MYRAATLITLASMMVLLSACANIEMGFDEDSVFSSKPTKTSVTPNQSNKLTTQENTPPPQEDTENETTVEYNSNFGYE